LKVAEAGVVAFRRINGQPEVLLVRAKKQLGQWIFPKGHVEGGESPEAAALRELREEAGVEGEVVAPLGVLEFASGDEAVRVEYYLVRFIQTVAPAEDREKGWFPYQAALRLLSFDDARKLLQTAWYLVESEAGSV